MPTEIKCPNCGHAFEPNDAIREEVEKELRNKAAEWQKKKNDEFQIKLEEEKKKLHTTLEENLRKNISSDFETKLRLLEQNNRENEEMGREPRKFSINFISCVSSGFLFYCCFAMPVTTVKSNKHRHLIHQKILSSFVAFFCQTC